MPKVFVLNFLCFLLLGLDTKSLLGQVTSSFYKPRLIGHKMILTVLNDYVRLMISHAEFYYILMELLCIGLMTSWRQILGRLHRSAITFII